MERNENNIELRTSEIDAILGKSPNWIMRTGIGIICIESYFKQEPTRLMVETLEPSVVWELPKAQIEELASKYDDIEQLYRKFIEHSLIESQIKADALRFEPAHERYNKLLRLHPEILKRAPLVYIASLLQMTPETLSRVRSSLL